MSQSSWKDQIKQKWGPHLHCPICGKAMPPDKKMCSQACKDNYIITEKKQKKKNRFQLICLVVLLVVMMLSMGLMSLIGGG
ncbi:MAG: DUF2116 family Zn-ribbon domain-containing protein [Promethearchaeota archaeon]